MKLNLDAKIIQMNGNTFNHTETKEPATVGDLLALPVGSVDLNTVRAEPGQRPKPNTELTDWQSRTSRKLAKGGSVEVSSSDISKIIECVQHSNTAPWLCGILLWRLGEYDGDTDIAKERCAEYVDWQGVDALEEIAPTPSSIEN